MVVYCLRSLSAFILRISVFAKLRSHTIVRNYRLDFSFTNLTSSGSAGSGIVPWSKPFISCSVMSFNHGLNDAQKVMGVITLALVAGGAQFPDADGHVYPLTWVKIACGLAISLGTAIGGWKVIKTLGLGLSKLNTMGGFAAESAASVVLYLAASLGVPVSTTHTITGAIVGVGSCRGARGVQWGVGEKILLAWIFTLPATAMLSGFIFWVLGIECGLVK